MEGKAKNELKYLKDTIIDLKYGMRMFHKKLEHIVEQCRYIYTEIYNYDFFNNNSDISDSYCSDILPNNISIKKYTSLKRSV